MSTCYVPRFLVPEALFVVAGDGPERERLESMAP